MRHLHTHPTIGNARPRLDLGGHIVEHQISTVGTDDENEVMLAGIDDDLAEQQGARWPAACEQFMPFADGVVVTIAARWIDHPLFAGQATFISLGCDSPVNNLVNLLEVGPPLLSQPDRAAPKNRTCSALVLVAQAELRVCHRRKSGYLGLDALDSRLQPHRHSEQSCMDRLAPKETGSDNPQGQSCDITHWLLPACLFAGSYPQEFEILR